MDLLDVPLDDIIKARKDKEKTEKRNNKRGRGSGGAGGSGTGGRIRRLSRRGNNSGGGGGGGNNNGGGRSGGGGNNNSGGGRNRGSNRSIRVRRDNRDSRRSDSVKNGNPDKDWEHDLYRPESLNSGGKLTIETGVRVEVTGLKYDIISESLKGIFTDVLGTAVKSADVHFDRTGRSLGSGTVLFSSKSDAEEAVRRLNGAVVNGETISVKIAGTNIIKSNNDSSSSSSSSSNGGIVVTSSNSGSNRNVSVRNDRGNRGNRGNHGNRRSRSNKGQSWRTVKNTDQLDMELDEYKQN